MLFFSCYFLVAALMSAALAVQARSIPAAVFWICLGVALAMVTARGIRILSRDHYKRRSPHA